MAFALGLALISCTGCLASPAALRPIPAQAADLGPPPHRPGVVRLHIDTPGVELRGAASCAAPCDRIIDGRKNVQFYFTGAKIPETSRFTLGTTTGDVTATIRPGNMFQRDTGYVLAGISGYLLFSALESTLVGAIVNEVTHDRRRAEGWYVGAGINLVAAVGLIGAGLSFVENGSTTFRLQPRQP